MGFEISFRGKTVIVTGGSRGIGASCCEQFAKAGADVAIIYHNRKDEAERLSEDLRQKYPGQAFHVYALEAHVEAQNRLLIEQAIKDFKNPISAVIANAGLWAGGPSLDVTEATFDQIYGINVKGVFFLSQAIARHWIEEKHKGTIIVTASIGGHVCSNPLADFGFTYQSGSDLHAVYNSSKAAVRHLAKCLAAEWAPHNIRVLTTSPGYISTDMIAHISTERKQLQEGRFGESEEVANLTVYLASELSNFMTGTDVVIDGGYTIW